MRAFFEALMRRAKSLRAPAAPPPLPPAPKTTAAEASALRAWPPGAILLVGDSLSTPNRHPNGRGWVALLSVRIGRPIINDSMGGRTFAEGVLRLPELLTAHKPSIVLLPLGGNDGMRRTPLDRLGADMARACDLCVAAGARTVLFEMRTKTGTPAAYAAGFRSLYASTASQHGALLVKGFLDPLGDDPRFFEPDRTHPNTDAQPFLAAHAYNEAMRLTRG